MYKWIWNFLRITGNPERIQELKERANLDGLIFNFKAFVPVKEHTLKRHLTDEDVEKLDLVRRDDLWGTEQNAKDARIKEEEPDSIFYMFKTAVKILANGPDGEYKNFQNSPAKVARALKKLYPDLDIDWSCQGPREWSNLDIEFDYYDENGGLLDTWEDSRLVFQNTVTMDRENAEKFKKLYDKDDEWNWFSLAMIIPEPDNNAEEWMDYTDLEKGEIQKDDIGPALAAWRYENWGTPSEAMDSVENGYSLPYLFKKRIKKRRDFNLSENKIFRFNTLSFPPFKIYRKMAADGLVFKVEWVSGAYGYWAGGEGQVVDGCFLYEGGLINKFEKELIEKKDVFRLGDEYSPYERYDGEQIIVRNRKHLDQLLECVCARICDICESVVFNDDDFVDVSMKFGLMPDDYSYEVKWKRYGNVTRKNRCNVKINKPFNLNFLDVSRVTDMSGLFKGCWLRSVHDVKIKLDISQWDVSNVTKMANMFDGCDDVDFGDLSRWDRSKVTDC